MEVDDELLLEMVSRSCGEGLLFEDSVIKFTVSTPDSDTNYSLLMTGAKAVRDD